MINFERFAIIEIRNVPTKFYDCIAHIRVSCEKAQKALQSEVYCVMMGSVKFRRM